MSSFTKREFERFWSQVALPDQGGCMLWLGRTDRKGYGRVFVGGAYKGTHRLSLRHFAGGPPTEGLHAAHSCAHRHCVAPAHLRWATPKENEEDKGGQQNRVRGEAVCTAKLTDAQAEEIRLEAARGVPRDELRVRFGISRTTLNEVIRGRRYRTSEKAGAR